MNQSQMFESDLNQLIDSNTCPSCLLIDGISDFQLFSNQIQRIFGQNTEIIQISSTLSFISVDINFENFFKEFRSKSVLSNYKIFNIFLKKSFFDQLINDFNEIGTVRKISKFSRNKFQNNLFYLCYQKKSYSPNFDEIPKMQDIKYTNSYPQTIFYGFGSFSDLINAYIFLIKNGSYWPIFGLHSSYLYKIQENKKLGIITIEKMKENNILMAKQNKNDFPLFNPEKNLFYVGFVEPIVIQHQKMRNVEEIYSVKNVNDVQISCLYQENEKNNTIRTFLGFDDEFRCRHVYDYFFHLMDKRKNSFFDLNLVNVDQTKDFKARSDLYYIEIQQKNNFDKSLLKTFKSVDSINSSSSCFYGFDNLDDFQAAKKILSSTSENSLLVKNIRCIEPSEFFESFNQKLAANMKKSKFSFLIFRIKRGDISNLKSYLKGNKLIEKNVVYNSFNKDKKFFLIGFKDNEDRNKSFTALSNSMYTKKYKCFYPEKVDSDDDDDDETEDDPTINDNKSDEQQPSNQIEKSQTNTNNSNEQPQTNDLNKTDSSPISNSNSENITTNENTSCSKEVDISISSSNSTKTEDNKTANIVSSNSTNDDLNSNSNSNDTAANNANLSSKSSGAKKNKKNKKNSESSTENKSNISYDFTPNQNLIYFYFIEKEKARKISQGKEVKSLFGVKKCQDVQRYRKIVGSNDSGYFTFFGFDKYEDVTAAINVIKSKWLANGQITVYESTEAYKKYQNPKDSSNNEIENLQTQHVDDQKSKNKSKNKNKNSQVSDKKQTLDSIKVNTYKSIETHDDNFLSVNQFSIPNDVQNELKDSLSKIKTFKSIQKDLIPHNSTYEPHTFFFFNSKDSETEEAIKETFSNHSIEFYDSEFEKQLKNLNFITFEERLIPESILDSFLHYISLILGVCEIKRNVFYKDSIVTMLFYEDITKSYLMELLEMFLSQENCLFDTSKYPLNNTICLKQDVMLKDVKDFKVFINELEKIGLKPIQVEENKLLFFRKNVNSDFIQKFSFICFENSQEKMKALNHLNQIVFGGKTNILKCNPIYFYIKCDPFNFKDFSTVIKKTDGIIEIQQNVLSIENPIELTYMAFDSADSLNKAALILASLKKETDVNEQIENEFISF